MTRKRSVLLIDVRDPNEYAKGHIPGAINISRGRIEFDIWRRVGGPESPDMKTHPFHLHCANCL